MPGRDRACGRSLSPPSNPDLPSPQSDPSSSSRSALGAGPRCTNGAATRHVAPTRTGDAGAFSYTNGHDLKRHQRVEIYPYDTQTPDMSLNGLIVGCSSDKHSALQYYPSTRADCHFLLDQFLQNFETAIHLCHRPTLQRNFEAHVAGLERLRSANAPPEDHFQSLAFAIFFAATYAMRPDAVAAKFNSIKAKMLQRFQNGLALALDREGFISNPSIPVLQAFVLFMTCKCRDDDMQQVWALVGLAVRIAQSLNLHQEPALLDDKLDAVEVEVRRRLWHQIFYIDFRAAVSQGLPPLIALGSYTTRLPTNVNDDSLIAGQEPLSEGYNPASFTEMTMQLVRLNGTRSMQQLLHMAPPNAKAKEQPTSPDSLGQQEQEMRMLIEMAVEKNQMLYINYTDSRIPLHRLTQSLANHIKWKFWIIYHQRVVRDRDQALSSAQSILTFSQTLNLLHSSLQIAQDKELDPFRWMIDSHSTLNACLYIVEAMEDAERESAMEPQLLQQAKQLLNTTQQLNSGSTAKSWLALNDRINKLLKTAPALEVAAEPEMEDAVFTDLFANGDIVGIDDWTRYMDEFM